MSDSSGPSVPWAGIAVVVALVSSTFLVPRAFEQLRPPEKERALPPPEVELEVDARLWEDPFFALRRYETDRADRCGKPQSAVAKELSLTCETDEQLNTRRDPAQFVRNLKDKDHDGDKDEVLIIAAMVPGNPFVGAEEGRRRTRYAILAGLQAKGYVPENAERIGLLRFNVVPPAASIHGKPEGAAPSPANNASDSDRQRGNAPPGLIVPYEVLSERPLLRGDTPKATGERYSQIALLWVDEAALPQPKLDSLARLFSGLLPKHACKLPHLAIIGPSSSDNLRTALADLKKASKRLAAPPLPQPDFAVSQEDCGTTSLSKVKENALAIVGAASVPVAAANSSEGSASEVDRVVRNGYWLMSHADFLNPIATAANHQLEELNGQKLESFLNEKFSSIIGGNNPVDVSFKRMIATDSDVLRRLVKELELRLPSESNRRVVLVAERDSLYAQALVSELRHRMRDLTTIQFEVVYFYRGLDGVTTRDGAEKLGTGAQKSSAGRATDSPSAIEWPESRDQLDYLRRMAVSLKDSEASGSVGRIGAIGILGNDVHDKLLVLQALHDTFADKVFFTTDMDARYLHPATLAFTRNLIVASSLPLEFPRASAHDAAQPGGGDSKLRLQAGTPPLRDAYQSASYLAARRAACRDKPCRDEEDQATRPALENPSIYEIGRSRAVPLAGYAFATQTIESNRSRVVVAVAMLSVFAMALFVWPSTPAMRRVRAMVLPSLAPRAGAEHIDLLTAGLVALHVALLAFAIGSLIEFVAPGHLDFVDVLLLTALSSFGVLLGLYSQVPGEGRSAVRTARRRFPLVVIGLIGLVWFWILWRATGRSPCLDCEPVEWLEGVSAWPSHLIHLIALMVIAWGLDKTWSGAPDSLRRDSSWLHVAIKDSDLEGTSRSRRSVAGWFSPISVAYWRRAVRPSVRFNTLWLQYVSLGTSAARVTRTMVWYIGTVGLVVLLFVAFSDGQVPEVPVRGEQHRSLVGWTLYATLLLMPLLVVAVADATVLTSRFMWHLNRARTAYSDATVRAFAEGFGPDHRADWTARMAADPAQRDAGLAGAHLLRHTLLDNWIDVQVVARRTALVAPLVIWPFVVLALLVVARSRLFDNWSVTLPVAVSAAAYLLWLIVLALVLKFVAEETRNRALERMNADLRWLGGSDDKKHLVEPFKGLIGEVQNNHTGAFAQLFDQPLFRAILVPLGGVGGAQLFDYFLLAR